MKAQKFTLVFYIVCFFLFALPAILAPHWFATILGYDLNLKGSLMEFVAAYGGLIIGVGSYLIYCLNKDLRGGVIAILIVMGSLFVGRVVGYGIEQEISGIQQFFLIIELITLVLVSSVLYFSSDIKPV